MIIENFSSHPKPFLPRQPRDAKFSEIQCPTQKLDEGATIDTSSLNGQPFTRPEPEPKLSPSMAYIKMQHRLFNNEVGGAEAAFELLH